MKILFWNSLDYFKSMGYNPILNIPPKFLSNINRYLLNNKNTTDD